MTSRTILESKRVSETRKASFDFTSDLSVGETLSTATTGAVVYSGTDGSPSAIVSGSAAISGAQVSQALTGGTEGVTYLVTVTATTSAGQTVIRQAFLTVVPAGV